MRSYCLKFSCGFCFCCFANCSRDPSPIFAVLCFWPKKFKVFLCLQTSHFKVSIHWSCSGDVFFQCCYNAFSRSTSESFFWSFKLEFHCLYCWCLKWMALSKLISWSKDKSETQKECITPTAPIDILTNILFYCRKFVSIKHVFWLIALLNPE